MSTVLAVEAAEPVARQGVSALLDAVDHILDGLSDAVIRPQAALDVAQRLIGQVRRLEATRMRALAVADKANAARANGALSTAAWLRMQGERPGDAKRAVELATKLEEHERVARAMGAGDVSADQARVITDAVAQLPVNTRSEGEAQLLRAAQQMHPGELAKEATKVVTRLDPDGSRRLEAAEQAAKDAREFAIVKDRTGRIQLVGQLDVEGAAVLNTALSPLAAPRPAKGGQRDERSAGQRMADALVELARQSLTSGDVPTSGGLRPTVMVTMTLDQLTGQAEGTAMIRGAALHEPISAAAARRWACDAAIIPAVLGGKGQLLDLGRATRTANPAQRKALILRDGGCAFPGCDRPPAWTDAHHVQWWRHGGRTDLDNLVLLCGAHHDSVHHHGWTVRPRPGLTPTFHPPDRR